VVVPVIVLSLYQWLWSTERSKKILDQFFTDLPWQLSFVHGVRHPLHIQDGVLLFF
jgi:hypothetical protein